MVTKLQITRAAEQRIPMSYDEFLVELPENSHAEWVDGEAIIFLPPTIRHQDIVIFFASLLRLFVDFRRLGILLAAPVEMRLVEQNSAREPDILFVAAANLERLTPQRVVGAADLAVEVISDESVTRDRVDKWREYQAAGVREYWIIDPRPGKQATEFWALDEYGRYQAMPVRADGIFHSQVLPGFRLDVAWLQGEELPNVFHCFAQIVGPDALQAALA